MFSLVWSVSMQILWDKKAFTWENSPTPTGLAWDTKMATISLFGTQIWQKCDAMWKRL